MTVTFPYAGYEEIRDVDIPDTNLLGVFSPRAVVGGRNADIIGQALREPISAPRLREAVVDRSRVLILIDDNTRGTPVTDVLELVIPELQAAGISDEQITMLTAQGSHRRMTDAELRAKLGAFVDRFRVRQHDWLDGSALHEFGRTSDGTAVRLNALLAQADFILGVGSIVPHRIKGFSGGAKIVVPGVAGPELQARNQWEATQQPSEMIMGVADNAMRRRSEEAARMAGLSYIVNCIPGGETAVAGCVAGDFVAAHRAGCRLSRAMNEVELPEQADVVLIESHPADRDVWQSAKAIYAGAIAVRNGGTLIVVAPNPEGVADHHPIVMQTGYRPFSDLRLMVQSGKVNDLVGIAVLAHIAQVIDRVQCVMVSPGLTRAQVERLGFRYANSAQAAVDDALLRHGRAAKVVVLRRGGHILPRIGRQLAHA